MAKNNVGFHSPLGTNTIDSRSNFQGLTSLSNCESSTIREELSDSDLCPFLISDTTQSIFQRPVDDMVWRIVRCHLRCFRISDSHHVELQTKDCISFHITFYEVLKRNYQTCLTELWPCGKLHSDGQSHAKPARKIRESALTVSPNLFD